MKYLHPQFILACAALGLGFSFMIGALWIVYALPIDAEAFSAAFLSAVLAELIGLILLVYGVHGLRYEFHKPRK